AGGGTSLSSKAKTSALNALHRSYVQSLVTETDARSVMTALGEPDAEQAATIAVWDQERSFARKALSVKEITNAIGQPGHDYAWAANELSEIGYSADEILALIGTAPA